MENAKTYIEKWEKGIQLGKGGQATTFNAHFKTNSSINGALKILNRQDDNERRARMYRETVNLQTLDYPRIPKVIDSNTALYKDLSAKLYLVTDLIPGGTLSENLKTKPDFTQLINTVLEINKAMEYSHKRGIVHRDIKPDNIILKEGKWSQPFVIDFGISFNNDNLDDDDLTPTGQHLGNRFLVLPEQRVGESHKRDSRSDITSCIGILFYLLTGLSTSFIAKVTATFCSHISVFVAVTATHLSTFDTQTSIGTQPGKSYDTIGLKGGIGISFGTKRH